MKVSVQIWDLDNAFFGLFWFGLIFCGWLFLVCFFFFNLSGPGMNAKQLPVHFMENLAQF